MNLLIGLSICLTVFSGCDKMRNALESAAGNVSASAGADESQFPDAIKLDNETRYYNDYLGISYSVPKGWWLYEVSGENLSESSGGITDEVSMDIGYGDFGDYSYSNLWLLSFGNLEESTRDNHLGFYLEAESLEGISDISGFMEYHESYMLEPTDEEEYELLESETASIGGRNFELRNYLVSREEDNYRIMTLSCAVKNGYFLNILVDYWPRNTRAKQAILDTVAKAVAFY